MVRWTRVRILLPKHRGFNIIVAHTSLTDICRWTYYWLVLQKTWRSQILRFANVAYQVKNMFRLKLDFISNSWNSNQILLLWFVLPNDCIGLLLSAVLHRNLLDWDANLGNCRQCHQPVFAFDLIWDCSSTCFVVERHRSVAHRCTPLPINIPANH